MIKVYLAEDFEILRESLVMLLNEFDDIEVVGSCGDGQTVVNACDEILVDVILMDIQMPIMDGLDAARKIKRRHPYIKIIMLTMHNDYEFVKSVRESGVDGYLLKNTDKSEMIKAIKMVCDGGNYYTPASNEVYIEGTLKANEEKTEPVDLTDRELEIVKLICEGASTENISETLNLSAHTVSAHRRNIYRKTACSSSLEILKFCMKHGIVKVD